MKAREGGYIGGDLSWEERYKRYIKPILSELRVMDSGNPRDQCRCGTTGRVKYRGRWYCPRCGRRGTPEAARRVGEAFDAAMSSVGDAVLGRPQHFCETCREIHDPDEDCPNPFGLERCPACDGKGWTMQCRSCENGWVPADTEPASPYEGRLTEPETGATLGVESSAPIQRCRLAESRLAGEYAGVSEYAHAPHRWMAGGTDMFCDGETDDTDLTPIERTVKPGYIPLGVGASVDTTFEAMVGRAVAVVVEFNVEMGEEPVTEEDRYWCEILTRRVFDAIELEELLSNR